MPHRPGVAVNSKHSVFGADPFEISGRDPKWFEQAKAGFQDDRSMGLPTLRPAWALADMLRTQWWGACGPQPDDIDWDAVTQEDEADWQAACEAFDLPCSPLLDSAMASR